MKDDATALFRRIKSKPKLKAKFLNDSLTESMLVDFCETRWFSLPDQLQSIRRNFSAIKNVAMDLPADLRTKIFDNSTELDRPRLHEVEIRIEKMHAFVASHPWLGKADEVFQACEKYLYNPITRIARYFDPKNVPTTHQRAITIPLIDKELKPFFGVDAVDNQKARADLKQFVTRTGKFAVLPEPDETIPLETWWKCNIFDAETLVSFSAKKAQVPMKRLAPESAMMGSEEELADLGVVREYGPVNKPDCVPPIINSPEKVETVSIHKPTLPPPKFEDLYARPTAIQHAIFKLMKTAPPQIYAILAQNIQQADVTWATLKEAIGKAPEFGWPQTAQVLAIEASQAGPSSPPPVKKQNATARRLDRRRQHFEKQQTRDGISDDKLCRYHKKFGSEARICGLNGCNFPR
ncbi:hypothetical protein Ciccas_012501 [Cichlidogyrus casuarinus]|uniref:Gag protein n=1 Tax=Cichlidogyrus casuarinus TaxID=1844966 RepID=A0ABD2PN67_9PLAT